MTLDEFLTLPFHERVKWLHGKDGPEGKLSHDRLAERLGTSRQVIINWEKVAGAEPEPPLRAALSEFSGFPVEAFSRREGELLVYESFGRRLRELEDGLERLSGQVARLLEVEATRRSGRGGRPGGSG